MIAASRLDKTLITYGNGSSLVHLRRGRAVLGCPRNYDPGSYNLEICRLIWTVVYGIAGRLQRRHRSWWYHSVNDGVLFIDAMILYSPAIWVFPGLCIGCWTGSIGPYSLRSALTGNLPALGGHQWVTSWLVTVGTGWLWTFWTCRLQRPKEIGTF